LRSYLEKKAAKKEAEKATQDESLTNDAEVLITEALPPGSANTTDKKLNPVFGRSSSMNSEESTKLLTTKVESKKGFWKFRSNKDSNKSASKRGASALESFNENETEHGELVEDDGERPAFSSMIHGSSSSSKKIEPRAVAIPYSRLKKDRFFDWPPDPTVSRATPMDIFPEAMEDIDSLTLSVAIPEQEDEFPSSLRRRHAPIPTNITF